MTPPQMQETTKDNWDAIQVPAFSTSEVPVVMSSSTRTGLAHE